MKRCIVFIVLAAGCGRPEAGPAPISYGEDACDLCRMIISEAPYAAEARFGPDKIEKYDDIGCLGERLWEGPPPVAMWVADHSSGRLHPVSSVALVHVKDLKTPMACGVAAFADRAEAEAFTSKYGGRFIGMDEIKSMRRPPKR
ncbi:MAG TPA: nitrous oxide reductase accessory protein NosL [Planctomycetota bacterium]|nr:nitrous oxide reductase accessory protein NosL [Planctomycetota bacterium]